jgi:Synergist-CTERM protein sorting domain-containing protein
LSGGGGCDAGFGLFGLLLLAVLVTRKHMTA